jgi:hypothetical protein
LCVYQNRRAVQGLPHAGILANKCLCRKLAPFGYYESVNTPGLWHHALRPLTFTLVIDNYEVKFANKDDVNHLISSISTMHKLTKDWTNNLYCGITLEWDYVTRTVDISMPGYIKKKLQKYEHVIDNKRQTCPSHPSQRNLAWSNERPSHPTAPHASTQRE